MSCHTLPQAEIAATVARITELASGPPQQLAQELREALSRQTAAAAPSCATDAKAPANPASELSRRRAPCFPHVSASPAPAAPALPRA